MHFRLLLFVLHILIILFNELIKSINGITVKGKVHIIVTLYYCVMSGKRKVGAEKVCEKKILELCIRAKIV